MMEDSQSIDILLKSANSNIIQTKKEMQCHCNSKNLYKNQYIHPEQTFSINEKQILKKRQIDESIMNSSHPHQQLEHKIIETAELWLPSEIDRISWNQVTFNPLWFHKKYLSKNVPCIITDVFQGDDIYERWAQPQYLIESTEGQQHSISLTPNGFADSIQGNYFIEPHQEKATLKQFFDHKDNYPNAVPYIQHQNGNLSSEFQTLNCEVSQQVQRLISQYFFKGKNPDAQNLWLGFDDSVSSLHKDPYQNFYLPLVGQKHFTLLPPLSILYLEQQQYDAARWKYENKAGDGKFTVQQSGFKNRWICVNPDLHEDNERFARLKEASKYHVTVKKEEMLYLPSLWYHQVSQVKGKNPYSMAINYWFDMDYSQNYSLYETCRALRKL